MWATTSHGDPRAGPSSIDSTHVRLCTLIRDGMRERIPSAGAPRWHSASIIASLVHRARPVTSGHRRLHICRERPGDSFCFRSPCAVASRLGEVGYSNPRADVSCCTEAPCARESAGAKGKFWGQPELARSRQDAPRTSETLSRCARFVALGELKEKIDRSHCCDCWAPERAREAGRKRGLAARQRLLSRDLHRRPTVKALVRQRCCRTTIGTADPRRQLRDKTLALSMA